MTFIEMIKHLKNGKKARRIDWENNTYIEFESETRHYWVFYNDDFYHESSTWNYKFSDNDLEAEWEIFDGKEG